MKIPRIASLVCLVLATVTATTARAQVVTPNPAPTIITTAPYTISTPGYYQLGADLTVAAASGNIITINASNVTLDFGGHYISGPSNNNGTTLYGVFANEQGNLVIRNGTIAFCYYGMAVRGNNGATSLNINQRVDNMLVSYCYYVGISLEYARNSEVTNCRISSIGSTNTNSSAYGLEIYSGSGNKAVNNTITTITGNGSGTAYGLSGGSGFYANGNFLSDVTTGSGSAYGIYNPEFAVGNIITNARTGISGGIYQSNITKGATTAYTGGSDAGNNTSF